MLEKVPTKVPAEVPTVETEGGAPNGLKLVDDKGAVQSGANRQGRQVEGVSDDVYRLAVERWEEARAAAADAYEWLLAEDVARELARIDLPLSTYTQWYWKIDLHNLIHFLTLRVDPHSQWEIQQFGRVMAGMLKRVAPLSYEAWIDYQVCGRRLSHGELEALRRLLEVRDRSLAARRPTHSDRKSWRSSDSRSARSASCWRSWSRWSVRTSSWTWTTSGSRRSSRSEWLGRFRAISSRVGAGSSATTAGQGDQRRQAGASSCGVREQVYRFSRKATGATVGWAAIRGRTYLTNCSIPFR